MTAWAHWSAGPGATPYSVGVEEEAMLLQRGRYSLAPAVDWVLGTLPEDLAGHVHSETHSAAIELSTAPRRTVAGAVGELGDLRVRVADILEEVDLRAAVAGTHPFAVWHEMAVASGERHQAVMGSMRALARREPTFALHVHVGLPDPEVALRVHNRMRAHVPVLLALSANSPFWQGRDTGLASARTPLFQAFPRVGIPRWFRDYTHFVESVDLLIRTEAFPEPTFLWWDVRLQPRLGTIEVRIMDAQSTVTGNLGLVALVQCIARLEAEEGYASEALVCAAEALEENRFLAARDGVRAALVDPDRGRRVPLGELVGDLLEACRPHADDLGCRDELELVPVLFEDPSPDRQRRLAGGPGRLRGLVAALADDFVQVRPRRAASAQRHGAALDEVAGGH